VGGDDDDAAARAEDSAGFGEYRWQVIEVGGGHDRGDGVEGLIGERQETVPPVPRATMLRWALIL
jgi:hypothetical protein